MERVRITAYGRVQRVGYRDAVAEIARKLGIKGTVRNLEDEVSVEIIAEGEGKKLENFLQLVDIKDSPIEVERLEVQEEKATGEFQYFKITRGEPNEELGERIDVAGRHLYDIKNLQTRTLEKIDTTNEKLDATRVELGGKMDTMGDKIDRFSDATQKRFDHLDVKYGKVSDKLEKISNSLEKLVDYLPRLLERFDSKR